MESLGISTLTMDSLATDGDASSLLDIAEEIGGLFNEGSLQFRHYSYQNSEITRLGLFPNQYYQQPFNPPIVRFR